jgi:anti-anti-sigma factor
MPEDLNVSVLWSGGLALVEVAGSLDFSTAFGLEQHVTAFADRRTRRVTLDLSRLTFLDPTGLSALESAARLLRARCDDFVFVGALSPSVSTALETAALDGVTSPG